MAAKNTKKTGRITDFTSISSKGQVVIPKRMREALGLREGDLFAASITDDGLIVLKKLPSLITDDERLTLRRLSKAWKEIESGKSKTMSKEAFLRELKTW